MEEWLQHLVQEGMIKVDHASCNTSGEVLSPGELADSASYWAFLRPADKEITFG